MYGRTGSANLPLHGGHVPTWLRVRMAALGRVIVEALVHEYGRDELLRRLAHPFWFQSFGAVMGMDWHSSGITTSVVGALKRGLQPIQHELGVYVCGGRGAHSRKTPSELRAVGEHTGFDADALVHASRLVAKVDSAAVQDGYQLYLHAFFATRDGKWCVVQQGMNDSLREARRYHWQSENLPGFFESPHAAVEGRNTGTIINLADARAARSRAAALALVQSGPDQTVEVIRRYGDGRASRQPAPAHQQAMEFAPAAPLPHLRLPHHHDVRVSDVTLSRLHATLAAAESRGPVDFADLLMSPGVGARTVSALAFVAELVHGAPARFADPARYSLAHGGKDGHPFPVDLAVYDRTIEVLRRAVARARLGRSDALTALRHLDAQARHIEGRAAGPSLQDFIASERARAVAPRTAGWRG
jgi:uncharacterized protein